MKLSTTLCAHALLAVMALVTTPAFAVDPPPHVHEGDVLPLLPCLTDKANCKIEIDDLDDKEIDASTGFPIFEGDFGDLPAGKFGTDDPGYDHESAQFISGTILGAMAVGTLHFWNGSAWQNETPANEVITLIDALGNELVIDDTTTPTGIALIGEFDDGNLHEHLDMKVTNGASVGAYLFTLKLVGVLDVNNLGTPIYQDSDPFTFIMNRGLSFNDFEAAVAARATAPVPVPAAAWLFGSALAGLVVRRSRRRREV
jgi:hypothetical protein